jgi:hypothetical protein
LKTRKDESLSWFRIPPLRFVRQGALAHAVNSAHSPRIGQQFPAAQEARPKPSDDDESDDEEGGNTEKGLPEKKK